MWVIPMQIASSMSISFLRKTRADLSSLKTALENTTCCVSSVVDRKNYLMVQVDQLFANIEMKEGNTDGKSVKPIPYKCGRYTNLVVEMCV